MTISIVEDQGTHLLIASGERYAVIERRDNRYYNCHDDKRTGTPANDIRAVSQILDSNDWTGKEAARKTFEAVVERGTQLARRMR
jgi:hypothetical protein